MYGAKTLPYQEFKPCKAIEPFLNSLKTHLEHIKQLRTLARPGALLSRSEMFIVLYILAYNSLFGGVIYKPRENTQL